MHLFYQGHTAHNYAPFFPDPPIFITLATLIALFNSLLSYMHAEVTFNFTFLLTSINLTTVHSLYRGLGVSVRSQSIAYTVVIVCSWEIISYLLG